MLIHTPRFLTVNVITRVRQHDFDNMTALQTLDISVNQITLIDPYSFQYLSNLQEMYVGVLYLADT